MPKSTMQCPGPLSLESNALTIRLRRLLTLNITEGPTELHIGNPTKIHDSDFKFYNQKIPDIKILVPKNTTLQYLNIDLFDRTNFKT